MQALAPFAYNSLRNTLLTSALLDVKVISEEETSFSRTLVKGIDRFKKFAADTKDGKISG